MFTANSDGILSLNEGVPRSGENRVLLQVAQRNLDLLNRYLQASLLFLKRPGAQGERSLTYSEESFACQVITKHYMRGTDLLIVRLFGCEPGSPLNKAMQHFDLSVDGKQVGSIHLNEMTSYDLKDALQWSSSMISAATARFTLSSS